MKMHVDYDWSVRKLQEAPDDEECGAGIPGKPFLLGHKGSCAVFYCNPETGERYPCNCGALPASAESK